jgi:hypothetical protein
VGIFRKLFRYEASSPFQESAGCITVTIASRHKRGWVVAHTNISALPCALKTVTVAIDSQQHPHSWSGNLWHAWGDWTSGAVLWMGLI